MPNRTAALQWLSKAYHDLTSAEILLEANHYTDTISFDLQQALEKSLKAFPAYENKQIKKTHDLIELYELISEHLELDESEVRILALASNYYIRNRYPVYQYNLPSKNEVSKVLDFAQDLFNRCCMALGIKVSELL